MFFSPPNMSMTLLGKRLRVASFTFPTALVRWNPPAKPVLSAQDSTIEMLRPPKTWAFAMLLAPFPLSMAPSAKVTNERNVALYPLMSND